MLEAIVKLTYNITYILIKPFWNKIIFAKIFLKKLLKVWRDENFRGAKNKYVRSKSAKISCRERKLEGFF